MAVHKRHHIGKDDGFDTFCDEDFGAGIAQSIIPVNSLGCLQGHIILSDI